MRLCASWSAACGKAAPSLPLAAVVLAVFALAGCGSVSERMSEKMSTMPGIGLPADAPARSAKPQAYPDVLDMPPARSNTVLSDSEQQKLENDLVAARSRQNALAGKAQDTTGTGKKAAASTPATPAASGKGLY